MSNNMLTKNSVEINGHFSNTSNQQDQNTVLLAKLKSLIELGLSCDFTAHTQTSWHGYLCVMSDLVERLEITVV